MPPENTKLDQDLRTHRHDGIGSELINLSDIRGFIRTVDTAPTHTPRNLSEQFIIYKNATTYRFYWYDTINNEWRYATGA